jgi:hypothetical protein
MANLGGQHTLVLSSLSYLAGSLTFFSLRLVLAVPVKLLQESLGHVITVELKTGQTYRGKLADGEFES